MPADEDARPTRAATKIGALFAALTKRRALPPLLLAIVTLGSILMTVVFCAEALTSRAKDPVDLPAFYCSGEALNARANPYLEMPLGRCERALSRNIMFRARVVVPSPLPPYAIAFYAALARLPYALVHALQIVGSVLALALASRLLARLTAVPSVAIYALVFMLVNPTIHNGQPIGFLLLALVATGYYLSIGRDRTAALAAALLMLEPHVGLPVCASLFLIRPSSRVALLAIGTTLAAVSIASTSFALNALYFTAVLPAHALSEASFINQYSLTELVVALGVRPELAVKLGSLQYAATFVVGIIAARRMRSEHGALVAFVPILFAVIGGTFIHLTQIALAIPAALLLAKRAQLVPVAAVILTLIFVDWSGWELSWGTLAITAFASFTFVTVALNDWRAGLLVASLIATLTFDWSILSAQRIDIPVRFAIEPLALAETSWAKFLAHVQAPPDVLRYWLVYKLPVWAGLIFFASLPFVLHRRRAIRSPYDEPALVT